MKIANMLNRSEFARNIVKLASGTAIAQVISIGAVVILSRLFTEEDFGLFGLITSIYGFASLISGGRYDIALLLPKRNTDAANLLVLSVFFNFAFLIFFYLVIIVLAFFGVFENKSFWFYILPLFIFFTGVIQTLSAWFNRRKKYHQMVKFRVSQSVMNNGFSILFGVLKVVGNGMLSGFFLSAALSIGVLMIQLKQDFRLIMRSISLPQMKLLAKKYYRFPVFNSFQSLLDAFQINGLIYFVSTVFHVYFVGVLSLALRVLFAPMNFVGSAISQVFYQEATALTHQNKSIYPLLKSTMKKSALLMIPVLVVLLAAGPQFFAFVFGAKWYLSGVYAQYLAPWICLDFIRAPLSQIPLIFHKQHQMLIFTVISNSFLVLVLTLGYFLQFDLKVILLFVSLGQVLYVAILLLWIIRITKAQSTSVI